MKGKVRVTGSTQGNDSTVVLRRWAVHLLSQRGLPGAPEGTPFCSGLPRLDEQQVSLPSDESLGCMPSNRRRVRRADCHQQCAADQRNNYRYCGRPECRSGSEDPLRPFGCHRTVMRIAATLCISLILFAALPSSGMAQEIQRQRAFRFENESLRVAIDSLMRWYGCSIVYFDSNVSGISVTSRCTSCSVVDALEQLLNGYRADVDQDGKPVHPSSSSGSADAFHCRGQRCSFRFSDRRVGCRGNRPSAEA